MPCPRPRANDDLAIRPVWSMTTSTTTSPRVPEGSCDRSGFGEGWTTTRARVVSPSPRASAPVAAPALVEAEAGDGVTGAGVGVGVGRGITGLFAGRFGVLSAEGGALR